MRAFTSSAHHSDRRPQSTGRRSIGLQSDFEDIVGRSEPLRRALAEVEQVAATDTTVLILGETGTGKERFARAIHRLSSRNDRPLVTVSCGAIPSSLVESELFGHTRGAFTGAVSRRIGRFEIADGGTIFLDEIGDLPLASQAKLLRVLQEGEFERVGESRTVKVDVRVIAATHRDLERLISAGDFREDLFYRLNVFPIVLPPLRELRDDIPLLVWHFLDRYADKAGRKIDEIPRGVMDVLQAYRWPGNIRELENVIERAVILTQSSTLRLDESFSVSKHAGGTEGKIGTLQQVEHEHIVRTLAAAEWKIEGAGGAAEYLGLNPSTLRSRMRKLGISRPTGDT